MTTEAEKKFLKASLGDEGAAALLKAVGREPKLASVLIPRAIVGWLSFVTQNEYEGAIPGIDNSYVQFTKAQTGFSGVLGLSDGVYEFQKSSLYHLASAISLAIGHEPESLDPAVRDIVLNRLGKSIDTLAKAQVVTQLLAKRAMGPMKLTTHGSYHVEHTGNPDSPYSVIHSASAKPVQTGIKSLKDADSIAQWHHKTHGPAGPANLHLAEQSGTGIMQAPTAQIPPIGPKGPISKAPAQSASAAAKPKAMSVTKSQAKRQCHVCGGYNFVNDSFKGCICFRDLAPDTTTTSYRDGYVLEFRKSAEPEAVALLLRTLKKGK